MTLNTVKTAEMWLEFLSTKWKPRV